MIGELAAGIIHEINNPVACIGSNVALLLQRLPKGAKLDPHDGRVWEPGPDPLRAEPEATISLPDSLKILEELAAASDLITSMASSLKTLTHSAVEEPRDTDLHECIEAALKIASYELKYRVRVEKDFGRIPTLVAHPGLLVQVFLNLFVNAAQAIHDVGTLRILTRCDGSSVLAEVADTGSGIPLEHLRRIFSPFFTTKPTGKGLGLGLSICRRIIDRHGGDIRASSAPGKGTTFRIRLPLTPGRRRPKDSDPCARASELPWRANGSLAAHGHGGQDGT